VLPCFAEVVWLAGQSVGRPENNIFTNYNSLLSSFYKISVSTTKLLKYSFVAGSQSPIQFLAAMRQSCVGLFLIGSSTTAATFLRNDDPNQVNRIAEDRSELVPLRERFAACDGETPFAFADASSTESRVIRIFS